MHQWLTKKYLRSTQQRLCFDQDTNSIALDGVSYNSLDPAAFQIVFCLHAEKQLRSTLWIQTNVKGCSGGDKTIRRKIKSLPEPLQQIIKAKRGGGRWVELLPVTKPPA